MDNIVLIIPAYEPPSSFIELVCKLTDKGFRKIIIVNDGSTEQYEHIFEKISQNGPKIIKLKKNYGKGYALKCAINYAIKEYGKEISIITADCDGQHSVEDIVKIKHALQTTSNSLILGVRKITKKTPFASIVGNIFLSALFFLLTKKFCKDTQTGLRGIPNHLLKYAINAQGKRYEYETNFLFDIANKTNFVFVPIQTIYINKNKNSHFKKFYDSIKILQAIHKLK